MRGEGRLKRRARGEDLCGMDSRRGPDVEVESVDTTCPPRDARTFGAAGYLVVTHSCAAGSPVWFFAPSGVGGEYRDEPEAIRTFPTSRDI